MKKIAILPGKKIVENRPLAFFQEEYRKVFLGTDVLLYMISDNEIDLVDEYVDFFDGFIFTGGNPLSPFLYGSEPQNPPFNYDLARDAFEMAILKEALQKNKAILGICRGFQLVNVALGGTLNQKLRGKTIHFLQDEPAFHSVSIEEGSHLSNYYGLKTIVNSYHRQGIERLGKSLKASAFAPDGCIEAFENKEKRILGVAWHPELLDQSPEFIRVFHAFSEMI